ncbi:unnamed protein product [Sympodiomycopsis kandeliae]
MPSFTSTVVGALPLLALFSGASASPTALTARAETAMSLDSCDCGFVDATDSTETVYTTYFRMDFTSSEWTRTDLAKAFRLSNSTINKQSTAPYQRDFSPDQVSLTSSGLALTVSPPADLTNGSSVPCAGVYSKTQDFGFGSYHLTAKASEPNGAVNAFFVYKNDTSEVDMEYVSRDAGDGTQFIRNTVKPQIYGDNGKASPLTYDAMVYQGDGSISDEFHDWAFKWNSDSVTFAFDGNTTGSLTTNVPQDPGLFALSAWSDGGKGYSQGPPTSNATFLISQVWVLYNSSTSPVPVSNYNGKPSNITAMTCSARKTPCYVKAPSGTNDGLSSRVSSSGGNTSSASAFRAGSGFATLAAGLAVVVAGIFAL